MCQNNAYLLFVKEFKKVASIVKYTDKRSGITYAYESVSYWDKEKKMPRCRRKLIGRVDPETGKIVPTDGRNLKNSPYQKPAVTEESKILDEIKPMKLTELRKEIVRLRLENRRLENELQKYTVKE